MKISKMTTHVVGTPWRDLTFVQIFTDEVSWGWGRLGCSATPRPCSVTSPRLKAITSWEATHLTLSRW